MKHLAISPCPNDTFAFYAWLNERIPDAPKLKVHFEDIETLNQRCFRGDADLVKVSFHAFLTVTQTYQLLPVGSALGFGCGPLLVMNERLFERPVHQLSVASPGRWTTAELLLRLWAGPDLQIHHMPFHQIMPSVAEGRVDAGLIIHESRFTYPSYNLRARIDLGSWWEEVTGGPIPLGGIAVKSSLPLSYKQSLQRALQLSLAYAHRYPEETVPFMACHAQEMDREVMRQHVDLYVNEFTTDIGSSGRQSIEQLGQRALSAGLTSELPDKWMFEG